jgi:hypothetical protein
MLLRVSRFSFWLAALAAAVALAFPTGWETWLTGLAAGASALAFVLWRAGLAQVRQSETAQALLPEAALLTRSALADAAAMVERCCAEAGSFEAALHGVAHILMTELGALQVAVYRVLGSDAGHARVSELIRAQPGFHATERRVHLQRSALGLAIATRREIVEASGAVALPVQAQAGVVAVIELTGRQVGVEAEALTGLLALAQAELSHLAEPAPKLRQRVGDGGFSTSLGENA